MAPEQSDMSKILELSDPPPVPVLRRIQGMAAWTGNLSNQQINEMLSQRLAEIQALDEPVVSYPLERLVQHQLEARRFFVGGQEVLATTVSVYAIPDRDGTIDMVLAFDPTIDMTSVRTVVEAVIFDDQILARGFLLLELLEDDQTLAEGDPLPFGTQSLTWRVAQARPNYRAFDRTTPLQDVVSAVIAGL
jgi:hypothetical protein